MGNPQAKVLEVAYLFSQARERGAFGASVASRSAQEV